MPDATPRRPQHPNARLTPSARLAMVTLTAAAGWNVTAAADRFQISAATAHKWLRRYRSEGAAGLADRSSRPHTSPNRTPEPKRREVLDLRNRLRRGAGPIAHLTGLAPSTVQHILNTAAAGRLDTGDRCTRPEPRRYQRETPGEMVHLDAKKLAAIPDGGGHRSHGRGNAGPRQRVGYRYIHTAADDRTRLAYSEIRPDETGPTAAEFWHRAHSWFCARGVTVQRVLTDNGGCYRSAAFAAALRCTRTAHRRTRPYRPQTNGKVERFHRILLDEWAYIR